MTKPNITLQEVELPEFGKCAEMPDIPPSVFEAILNKTFKMNKIIIAILFIIIGSCKMKNKSDEIKQKIIGEWFYADENEYDLSQSSEHGYTFFPNNSVDYKCGHYKSIQSKIDNDNISQYIGSLTKYEIVGDTLKIFSLDDSKWNRRKIVRISNDTLAFQGERVNGDENVDCCLEKYVKHSQKLDTTFQFDRISLVSSGCYGSCPIFKVNLYSNGNFEFYGHQYTVNRGYFASKIAIEKYNEYANNFRKVNLSALKENYEADHTDDEAVRVYFWKNNKMIKKIQDYGRVSPSAFICAYTQLRNLYQQIELIKMDEKIGKQIFNDDFR